MTINFDEVSKTALSVGPRGNENTRFARRASRAARLRRDREHLPPLRPRVTGMREKRRRKGVFASFYR